MSTSTDMQQDRPRSRVKHHHHSVPPSVASASAGSPSQVLQQQQQQMMEIARYFERSQRQIEEE
jgi:hypothetical protein